MYVHMSNENISECLIGKAKLLLSSIIMKELVSTENRLEIYGMLSNISLKECINDVVPIGVFMQIKKRPDPIYKVLGPAIVKSWNKGFFEVIGFSNSGEI